MTKRILFLACCLLLATAACSDGTPTEVSGTPTVPIPDEASHVPTPPKP